MLIAFSSAQKKYSEADIQNKLGAKIENTPANRNINADEMNMTTNRNEIAMESEQQNDIKIEYESPSEVSNSTGINLIPESTVPLVKVKSENENQCQLIEEHPGEVKIEPETKVFDEWENARNNEILTTLKHKKTITIFEHQQSKVNKLLSYRYFETSTVKRSVPKACWSCNVIHTNISTSYYCSNNMSHIICIFKCAGDYHTIGTSRKSLY